MISEEKRKLLSLLFRHLDGIAITPIVHFLRKEGVLSHIKNVHSTSIEELHVHFPKANPGYLNVAFRALASQGFLMYDVSGGVSIAKTDTFDQLFTYADLYSDFYTLYNNANTILKESTDLFIDNELLLFAGRLNDIRTKYEENEFVSHTVIPHLEGVLLGPVLVAIYYKNRNTEFLLASCLAEIDDLELFFTKTGLIQNGELTPKGRFLTSKSYGYGVTVSYLPLLKNTDKFLFGDFHSVFTLDANKIEQHVFRTINVWGSGFSHKTYFKKVDDIVESLFNKPIEEQPKGVIDVGCGNGALLSHIFDVIWTKTKRRDYLSEKTPLILVGSDFNREALEETKRNLEKEDIWAETVYGDIGDPATINTLLLEKYNIQLSDLLNMRSFLDHNRPFNRPQRDDGVKSASTGAFSVKGEVLKNDRVEQSLVEHLEKWKPFIHKHGLLLIELHTLSPDLVADNLGKTPCTAYDVTHGMSDQYIVELGVFDQALKRAGMRKDKDHFYAYPNDILTTVSINLIY